jgi:hypothetical protein
VTSKTTTMRRAKPTRAIEPWKKKSLQLLSTIMDQFLTISFNQLGVKRRTFSDRPMNVPHICSYAAVVIMLTLDITSLTKMSVVDECVMNMEHWWNYFERGQMTYSTPGRDIVLTAIINQTNYYLINFRSKCSKFLLLCDQIIKKFSVCRDLMFSAAFT